MNPFAPYKKTLLSSIGSIGSFSFAISANMFTTYAGTSPASPSVRPAEIVWGVASILFFLLSLINYRHESAEIKNQAEENNTDFTFPPREHDKRQKVLQLVRKSLVEQDLRSRIDRTGEFISLRLSSEPDAIQDGIGWVRQDIKYSISTVYKDCLGQLLLLGEPGAGKTTLLLTLTEQLLKEAESDQKNQKPIPVVLNLFTWREKYSVQRKQRHATNETQDDTRFEQWAADQLDKPPYGVGLKLARRWLKGGALILLLDGLDEVALEQQADCVGAINAYRKKHGGLQPIVVCCRRHSYEELHAKLGLNGAAAIEPLNPNQVDAFLKRRGKASENLRAVLREKPDLYDELFSTPLFLHIAAETYANQSAEELLQAATREEREWRLWEAYIAEMFERKKPKTGEASTYADEKARLWLARLAAYLNGWKDKDVGKDNALKVYYIEETDASLLAERWRKAVQGLFLLCAFFSCLPITSIWLWYNFPFSPPVTAIIVVVVALWFARVAFLVISGDAAEEVHNRFRWNRMNKVRTLTALMLGLLKGSIIGLALCPIGSVSFWLYHHLVTGIAVSKSEAARFGLRGFIVVTLMGMITGFFLASEELNKNEIAEESQQPNVAIKRLLKQAGVAALLGAVFAVISQQILNQVRAEPFPDKTTEAISLVRFMPFNAIVAATYFGGAVALRHYILRFILWKTGAFPRTITPFMDYCATRILVQRVGGGWRFIHGTLQDHFAAQFREPAQQD